MWTHKPRHLRDRDFVRLYEGELKPRDEERLRAHLDECKMCSVEYEKICQIYHALETWPRPAVPAGVSARIDLRLAQPAPARTRRYLPPSFKERRTLAIAFGLVVLLIAAWVGLQWHAAWRPGATPEQGRVAVRPLPSPPITGTRESTPLAKPSSPAASAPPGSPTERSNSHRFRSHAMARATVQHPSSRIPSQGQRQVSPTPVVAVASRAQGQPTVARDGRCQVVGDGARLASGDVLHAKETDRLLMQLHDHGQILLDMDSRARIADIDGNGQGASAKIGLLEGRVWAWSPGDGGEIQVATASGLVRVHRGEALVHTHGPADILGASAVAGVEICALRGEVRFEDNLGRMVEIPSGNSLVVPLAPGSNPPRPRPFSVMITKYSGWGRRTEIWDIPQLKFADLLSDLAAPRTRLGATFSPRADLPQGMEVVRLPEHSVAAQVGVRLGDIVMEVAGKPLVTFADLAAAELRLPHMAAAEIVLRRGNQRIVVALPHVDGAFPSVVSTTLGDVAGQAAAGNLASALAVARRLANDQPKCALAWYDEGLLEEYRGDAFSALAAYKRAADLAPDDPEVTFALGRAYARIGNLERAAAALQLAARRGAGPRAAFLLGYVLLLEGNMDSGLSEAERLAASPAVENQALGEALRALAADYEDNLQAASKHIDVALRLDAFEPHIQFYAAMIRLSAKQVQPARDVLELVLHGYPDWAKAANLMGDSYAGEGNWLQARVWFEGSAKSPAAMELGMCNLANTYMKTGELGKAASLFRDALVRSPDFSAAHLGLGLALEKSGDWKGATQEYASVMELDPGNRLALRWDTALWRTHGYPELASALDVRYGLASSGTGPN